MCSTPGRRALTLEGREVPLQPRVFDLLCYVVEHRDRVVSREELLRGRGEEAIRGLKRAASLRHWVPGERKARYLALAARIAAELGQLEEARSLLQILAAEPCMGESGSMAGQVEYVRAELAWAEDQPEEALRLLHRALDLLRNGAQSWTQQGSICAWRSSSPARETRLRPGWN